MRKALEDLTKALSIKAEDKLAYQFRSEVFTKMHKDAEAQADLQKINGIIQ